MPEGLQIRSIAVIDDTVYAVGNDIDESNITIAKLWKNGIPMNLSDGTHPARAHSLFISGSDIYVGGFEENNEGIAIAKYWKNGELISMTDGSGYAAISSMAVVGADVYAVGYQYNNGFSGVYRGMYWKNGIDVELPTKDTDYMSYSANAIFITFNSLE